MNNLERIQLGTMQIWRAMPTWGRVTAVIVAVIGLYYSFALVLGLFFMAALAVGVLTLIRWFLSQ